MTNALRRIPVLLDAETFTDGAGNRFGIITIYISGDLNEWLQASTTVEGVGETLGVQSAVQMLLSQEGRASPDSGIRTGRRWPGLAPASPLTSQVTAELLERTSDVSASLRGLIRVHEEWLDTSTELLQELLLEVRNLNRTLRDLVAVTHP